MGLYLLDPLYKSLIMKRTQKSGCCCKNDYVKSGDNKTY